MRPLSVDACGWNRRSANDCRPIMSPSCPGLSPVHTPSERSPGHSIGIVLINYYAQDCKKCLQQTHECHGSFTRERFLGFVPFITFFFCCSFWKPQM